MRNGNLFLTRSALLLALASVFPLLALPQPVTGVAVNVILYISSALIGPVGGIIIGCLTPWLAALRGVLPPPLVVAAPFIMLGNIILVLTFNYFRNRIPLVGVIGAAFAKFAVTVVGAQVIIPHFLQIASPVAAKVAAILGLSQIFTALAGGFLALIILQAIPGKYLWENVQRNYRFY